MLRAFFKWRYLRQRNAQSIQFSRKLDTPQSVNLSGFLTASSSMDRKMLRSRSRWWRQPIWWAFLLLPLAALLAWIVWESIQALALF